MLELLEQALCSSVRLRYLEDNTQCLQAAETGYSAALRHLPRTERISIGVVHELFQTKVGMSWSIRKCLPTRETCLRKDLTRARSNVR